MNNGFSSIKNMINDLPSGSIIKRQKIVAELNTIISITSIDTVLRKIRGSGYLLPVVTIKNGFCKGMYCRSCKQIKPELNTTILMHEYESYFSKITVELGENISSRYLQMSNKLSQNRFITTNEVKELSIEKLVDCLCSIGILEQNDDKIILILKSAWNIPFTAMFDLYAYMDFIPNNYLVENKFQSTFKN